MADPVVLHITFDFPSPIAPPKMTRAVERLVDGATDFHNIVYAMTRVGWRRGIEALRYAPHRTAVAYGGLPKGVALHSALRQLAAWILADLRDRDERVDLVHAHKISSDGIVAHLIAKELGVPFVSGIWGRADSYVINGRPDLLAVWREVADRAAFLFPAAPWTASKFATILQVPEARMRVLPVIAGVTSPQPSNSRGGPLATVFHLDQYRNKNGEALATAVSELTRSGLPTELHIYGAGTAASYHSFSQAVRRHGHGARILFKGPMPAGCSRKVLKDYAGLVLPSLSETFGMVYIEALFAGIPVMYSRNQAIDGFFPPDRIGYACDPRIPQDIQAGIEHLRVNEDRLKVSIAELQNAGTFDFLKPREISARHQRYLREALI